MVDMSSSMAEKPACCLRGCGGRGGWARNLHAVDPRLARPQRGRISPHDHPTGMAAYRRCRSGRLGGYFGGMLSRAGAPVAMIGRQTFADAVKRNGLFLDTLEFQEMVRPEAAAEMSAARGAEVLLFCVKTTDTETAARELAPFPFAAWHCRQHAERGGQRRTDSNRLPAWRRCQRLSMWRRRCMSRAGSRTSAAAVWA